MSELIAEIGINHNGSLTRAYDLIRLAKNSGADMVKLQTWHPRDFTTPDDPLWHTFLHTSFSLEHTLYCIEYGKEIGIPVFTSIVNPAHVLPLVAAGVPFIKLGSDEIFNYPLIDAVAATKVPMMFSTGLCMDAADLPIGCIAFHCTSQYPTRVVHTFLEEVEYLWGDAQGLSTHVPPEHPEPILAAVASGLEYIEVHFTDDREQTGPDHAWSYDPASLMLLRLSMDKIEDAIGSGLGMFREPLVKKQRSKYLRSAHTRQDCKAGSILGPLDVDFLRPGTGFLLPDLLAGGGCFILARDVPAGTMITEADLTPAPRL